MPAPNPIFINKPFSLAHFRRVFGMSDPVKLAALVQEMPWDYFYRAYDFHEPTLHTDWVAGAQGGGTTSFAFNAQRNAALRGATGATDDAGIVLYYANAIFDAADNPFFWVRFVAPAAVTGFSFEIGFSDPKTDETLPAITDVDASPPTVGNGVTDCGMVHMDTDQAVGTARLVGDGTTGASVGLTLVNDAGTAWTPTASGIIDVIIGIRANLTYCRIWDSLAPMGVMQAVAQGPDTGVLLRPSLMFRTRNTTSKQIDLLKAVIVSEENRTA